MTMRPKEDEQIPAPKEVVSKLREIEDYNLALSLQEQEFGYHYDKNRTERKIMGVDTKKSKEEQELEAKFALEKRIAEAREIAKRDEEVARQFQMQIEAEEARRKTEQARIDEELAKRLQLTEGHSAPPVSNGHDLSEDERLARELQERYLRRLNRPNRRLNVEVQNQLNTLVATNTLPSPSQGVPRPLQHDLPVLRPDSSTLPPLPSYHEAISTPPPVPTTHGTHFPVADPITYPSDPLPTPSPNIGFIGGMQPNIGFSQTIHTSSPSHVQGNHSPPQVPAPALPPRPRVHFAPEVEANLANEARVSMSVTLPPSLPSRTQSVMEFDTRNIPQSATMMPMTVALPPLPPREVSSRTTATGVDHGAVNDVMSGPRQGLSLSNSLNTNMQQAHALPLTTRSFSSDLPTPPPEILAGFHPTNPFLQDLIRAQNGNPVTNGHTNGQASSSSASNGSYQYVFSRRKHDFSSEFGLPPPSSLAMGSTDGFQNGNLANSSATIVGQQKKIPTGGVRMLPPDANELERRFSQRPNVD